MKEKFGVRQFLIYTIVILLALSCLVPMINVIATSLSSSEAVSANQVKLLPVDFTFAAYERIIGDTQFWRSFGISVFRVIAALILNLIILN